MAAHLSTAQQYMNHRLASQTDACLSFLTDDIVIETPREGTHTGKAAVREYLEKTKPNGTWEAPSFDAANGKVVIPGKVKVGFVGVSLLAAFDFEEGGKIKHIAINRV
eukprot:comp6548_c0_seq1/m.2319 comp6548_c0_seq1/g.2319  ORF comp6548_c0_seq1/g.2319 comp6548_c0_seq1/m.2319 type:complete len:108 (-) comp6548_c0_seq1:373-696(-)